jgi:hypothetical protein
VLVLARVSFLGQQKHVLDGDYHAALMLPFTGGLQHFRYIALQTKFAASSVLPVPL